MFNDFYRGLQKENKDTILEILNLKPQSDCVHL